jgi:hypothetical protein
MPTVRRLRPESRANKPGWREIFLALILASAAVGGHLIAAGEPVSTVNEKPIEMAPVTITVTREKISPLVELYRNLDRLFQGPFLNVRGGPLIEAILYRYDYLKIHPSDSAIIIVEHKNDRVVSATTVYTKNDRLYASSQVLGDSARLRGLAAADIQQPGKIRQNLQSLRNVYLGAIATNADRRHARSSSLLDYDPTDPPGPGDLLGARMALADEEGDYSVLGDTMGQMFRGPAGDFLRRAYEALHDPSRAGLLPIARSIINLADVSGDPTKDAVPTDVVVFDWDGQHYMYNPDLGTFGIPIPVDPLTKLPYLCVKNGELIECINFCATYVKVHPDEKTALLAPPGGPYAAIYTQNGGRHLFSPFLGRTTLPKSIRFDDTEKLVQLHAVLVERETKRLAAQKIATNPNSIPDGLPGDDADMQMRRTYIALGAAGVPCQLVSLKDAAGQPLQPPRHALNCRWQGTTYTSNIEGNLTTSITGPETAAR